MPADALITVLLDNSGSMAALRPATIEAYNDFLAEQKTVGDALWSLIVFDHHVDTRFVAKPIADVDPLTLFDYQIGGGTALFDAVGRAISDIRRIKVLPPKVIVVVLTDGMDEDSNEMTKEKLATLISEAEQYDDWKFVFLGAEASAWQAGAIGVVGARTASFVPTAAGAQGAYASMTHSVTNYRSGTTQDLILNQAEPSQDEPGQP